MEVVRHWGADFVVTRGRKVYPQNLDGFVALDSTGERRGLLTYEIMDDQCEIVTLDAFEKSAGIGTALVERVRQTVAGKGCRRLWLITTNDNTPAIRFYRTRGFVVTAVDRNAIEQSRKLKPDIPETGVDAIAITDEVEMEMALD